LSSRFARVRVRAANDNRVRAEEWLLIEWPAADPEPVHYWLSTLPQSTSFKSLVASAMGRWMIERDYQELKSELGLSHYEGRNWRGFHHHATLCIAAYGFLMLERLRGKEHRSIQTTFPTQRLPAPRVCIRCSVTTPGRSPQCAFGSPARSLACSCSARAAGNHGVGQSDHY
jgi:SRSO17 transposase